MMDNQEKSWISCPSCSGIKEQLKNVNRDVQNLEKGEKEVREIVHSNYTALSKAVTDAVQQLSDKINKPIIWLITVMGGSVLTSIVALVILLIKS